MADTEQAPKDGNVLEEAQNLLVQGKRFMALEDYQSATDMLEQAVQLFDAFYGVGKIQCADAYLEYGLALVALANLEAGSGTDRIMKKAGIEDEEEGDDDVSDEEVDDEKEQGEEEEAKGVGASGEGAKDDEQQTPANGNANGKTEEDDNSGKASTNGQINGGDNAHEKMDTSEQAIQTKSEQSDPTPGTSSGCAEVGDDKDSEDAENEEATTIEIAWEVLCLAKRLFMTDESMDGRLKLAETLQKLGEISIEWDNNDNAVSILEECLNIRKAILSPEDRLIALTYYNLGLAHSFKSDIQNANENFQNAINVIEKRIETLGKDLEMARNRQDTVAASTYEREITELKELLPDIMMRMDDSKEDEPASSEVLKRTRDELQQEDEEVKKVCLDNSKTVDDISHLVKRKAA